MDDTDLKSYILAVTASALLCGAVTALLGEKGTLGVAVKLLAGIYMTLVIAAPLGQFRMGDFSLWREQLSADGAAITESGQKAARDAMAESIITATETYILEKAETLGAKLTVEVMLDDSSIPVPSGVRIRGNISPYNREKLSSIIQKDLGIPTEAQVWT